MKKVVNVGIGGRSFCLEEDAYQRLDQYLGNFREVLAETGNTSGEAQTKEVMADLESRISELLLEQLENPAMAVGIQMINDITRQLGMPDGSPEPYTRPGKKKQETEEKSADSGQDTYSNYGKRKLYRDGDQRVFGGVCSGLAHYFDSDTVLIRVLMLLAVFIVGGGLLFYLIMWIVVPKAVTPAQKCEMMGWPVTAENMGKFY